MDFKTVSDLRSECDELFHGIYENILEGGFFFFLKKYTHYFDNTQRSF